MLVYSLSFSRLPDVIVVAQVMLLLDFVLSQGSIDPSSDVRAAFLRAGRAVVDAYGTELGGDLLAVLGDALKRKPAKGEAVEQSDHRHHAAVVLMGAAGKHIVVDKEDKDCAAVLDIVGTLVDALKTPSEDVQRAVADCLWPLVQLLKGGESAKDVLEKLVDQVINGKSYGERRGAAFGVSSCVKGLGIPSLKQHDLVNRLREVCEKGAPESRQGALGAFELLSERMGLLFEPYVITIVPVLLKSFSHGSELVRDGAQLAAKVFVCVCFFLFLFCILLFQLLLLLLLQTHLHHFHKHFLPPLPSPTPR